MLIDKNKTIVKTGIYLIDSQINTLLLHSKYQSVAVLIKQNRPFFALIAQNTAKNGRFSVKNRQLFL